MEPAIRPFSRDVGHGSSVGTSLAGPRCTSARTAPRYGPYVEPAIRSRMRAIRSERPRCDPSETYRSEADVIGTRDRRRREVRHGPHRAHLNNGRRRLFVARFSGGHSRREHSGRRQYPPIKPPPDGGGDGPLVTTCPPTTPIVEADVQAIFKWRPQKPHPTPTTRPPGTSVVETIAPWSQRVAALGRSPMGRWNRSGIAMPLPMPSAAPAVRSVK